MRFPVDLRSRLIYNICMINVCGPRDPKQGAINTTSTSRNWSRGLSPFFLGPIPLYGNYVSCNMENAWQFAKVYRNHLDEFNEPSLDYWLWATDGWANPKPQRYPMGKGAIPEFSFWDGQRLTYVEARKRIYIPLYAHAVQQTDAYSQLREVSQKQDIWLWDFDGYDYRELGMTLKEVVNCPFRKMGHAFVLLMLLTDQLSPEGYFLE